MKIRNCFYFFSHHKCFDSFMLFSNKFSSCLTRWQVNYCARFDYFEIESYENNKNTYKVLRITYLVCTYSLRGLIDLIDLPQYLYCIYQIIYVLNAFINIRFTCVVPKYSIPDRLAKQTFYFTSLFRILVLVFNNGPRNRKYSHR